MLTPRHPASVPVERHVVRLPHGAVHYRAAGAGPVVVALHESPRSSLSLLPVIEALAGSCRVIALDTPGYGLSDPLPGDAPDLDAFVTALASVLDALGVGRIALYGTHTGAAVATAFADRHPDRVASLALDGISAFTPDEVASFRADYLPPWRPQWDGAHVMALWSRCRDLFTWFPWHDRSAAARLATEPDDAARVHTSALGLIQSGEHYAKAYVRAAEYEPNAVLQRLAMPVTVMARPGDVIAGHLDRLEPGGWRVRALGPEIDDWRAALRAALTGGDPAPPTPAPSEGSRFVALGDGWLHAIVTGPTDGAARFVLPDVPGDLAGLAAAEQRTRPHDRIVAIDPPGCGRSDPLAHVDMAGIAAAIDAALRALDATPATVLAEGASVAIARAWAMRRGWTGPIEAIDTPSWLDSGAVPGPLLEPMDPRFDGAHLTAAWFRLRDLMLYDTPPGCGVPVRRDRPSTDVARLDRRFCSLVEGPGCVAVLDAIRLAAAGST